ncbi:hypothetical protein PSD17_04290 [Pseudonocardia sp. D17]|nr:hypothetical protein PSD17_04290 [Pseudonocardia sp. D17]
MYSRPSPPAGFTVANSRSTFSGTLIPGARWAADFLVEAVVGGDVVDVGARLGDLGATAPPTLRSRPRAASMISVADDHTDGGTCPRTGHGLLHRHLAADGRADPNELLDRAFHDRR